MSRFAIISDDGLTVINTIVAEQSFIDETGMNAVEIKRDTLVQPGDIVIDLKALSFDRPPLDVKLLNSRKTEVADRLQAIADGTYKAKVLAATTLAEIAEIEGKL
jgi:hypothetical protein